MPSPDAALAITLVNVTHEVVVAMVGPKSTVAERSPPPRVIPLMVTQTPPLVARLAGDTVVVDWPVAGNKALFVGRRCGGDDKEIARMHARTRTPTPRQA
jgi:hypothetical protein